MKGSLLTNQVIVSTVVVALCIAVILLVLLFAIGTLYFRGRNLAWTEFKRQVVKKWQFPMWTLLLTILFCLVFAVAYHMKSSKTARAVITLNYAEASWGQNANGTRYNMAEIICDEVLSRAIKKGALEDVTVGELRPCLSVEPVVQGNSYDENGYHIATEFEVTFKADKNTAHLDAENLALLIANAYKEFYIDTYADNFSVLDPDEDFEQMVEDMDYLDIVSYLSTQAFQIENYMYELQAENASFASSNGDTFGSIAAKVDKLNEVQIENGLKAHVLYNGASKDADAYIGRLEYENMLANFDMKRASASFDVRNRAIEMYAAEMTRVVLVPTWDNDGEYYMGRTKVGIDDLSIEAENYSKTAAGYLKTMETNKSIITALEKTGASGEDPTAERLVTEIYDTLKKYAAAAKTAGQEYSESRMNKCISATVSGASFLWLAAVCAVMFALFYGAVNLLVVAKKLPKNVKDGLYLPEAGQDAEEAVQERTKELV